MNLTTDHWLKHFKYVVNICIRDSITESEENYQKVREMESSPKQKRISVKIVSSTGGLKLQVMVELETLPCCLKYGCGCFNSIVKTHL